MVMSLKILALADIHGHINPLKSTLEEAGDVDFILVAGDLSSYDGTLGAEVVYTLDEWCRKHGCKAFIVPGNTDGKEIASLNLKTTSLIHMRVEIAATYVVAGIGGGLGFSFWDTSKLTDDIMAKYINDFLARYGAGLAPYRWLLLTHTPPYGTKTDVLYTGTHVGSKALRALIESRKPLVTVCGHIHESRGVDSIGRTLVVNPGPNYRRFYGIIELDGTPKARLCRVSR
jgi:Icc-related predicted phosphoesterase